MTEPSNFDCWAEARDKLRSLDSAHRLRKLEICVPRGDGTGVHCIVGDKQLINFCSNDYLDLAQHPDVKQAAVAAVEKYGSGCMASRLICGSLPIHQELEQGLAAFKGAESALVFSSGYMASLGVIQALSLRADDSRIPVVFDRLAHASLVDAATAERRNWRSFPHNDVDSLELVLKKLPRADCPSAIVVTEGVFSMDGDVAPLKRLSQLCVEYHALLVVDDAHGTGVMGKGGEGTATMAGIAGEAHVVQIGTLSKALGSQGGFVTGPAVLRELLVNTARTFIFDTGLNPAASGAALAALRIIQEEPQRVQKLKSNISLFNRLLNRQDCNVANPSPIIPVLLHDEETAVSKAAKLRDEGFMVAAIRPPSVPQGTSRLRITIGSAHKEEDIRRLAQAVAMLESA